jgi:hypothetical protein
MLLNMFIIGIGKQYDFFGSLAGPVAPDLAEGTKGSILE